MLAALIGDVLRLMSTSSNRVSMKPRGTEGIETGSLRGAAGYSFRLPVISSHKIRPRESWRWCHKPTRAEKFQHRIGLFTMMRSGVSILNCPSLPAAND